MAIPSVLPPSKSRPQMQARHAPPLADLSHVLGLQFSFSTWILVGASLQALAVYLFSSRRYTLLIAVSLLLARLVRSFIQASSSRNPYLQDVIPGRVTAFLPDETTGEIESASSRKIAVLLLGAKSNHPFGILAPQFRGLNKWIDAMNDIMDAGEVQGFMGQTTFWRQDERGAPEFVLISYWRSIEDLWTFAHGGVHREAWQWWEKTIKDNGYCGINHEIYEADAKHWENVYVNFQPTLLGASTHLKRGDGKTEAGTVPDEWISPLVDARRGKLAKSSARLGREVSKFDSSRVAKDTYE